MNIILFEGSEIPPRLSRRDDRAQHILKILRLKAGDSFKCGLVNGASGICRIEEVGNGEISLSFKKTAEREDLYPVTLIVGYTRPISSKRILREAVSLGVRRLIFTGTDTGEKSYRLSNLWKTGEYRRYLIDGAQQAGQTALPDVLFFPDVKHTLQAVVPGGATDLLLLDNVSPRDSLAGYTPPQAAGAPGKKEAAAGEGADVILAVGSERGWSDRERALFREHGFTPVKLGERVLRTETACSAGCAVLLSRMGYI